MSNDYLKGLNESRNRAWEQAKALLDSASTESRDLTADERQTFDTINADIDTKDSEIRSLLEIEAREQSAAEARAQIEALVRPDVHEDRGQESAEAEALAYFRGERTGAFELRDQKKATAGAGGATVPTGFLSDLQRYQVENSAVLAMGPRFIDTTSGENITVPRVSAYGTPEAVAEGTAINTETDDTFGTVTLGAYKYMAFVQVSAELIADTGVDLLGFIAEDAGRKLGNVYGAALVTGNGTTAPEGIVTASTAAVTAASAALDFDDLIDLQHSLVTGYRRNGVFVMKDSTLAAVRKLKDQNDAYIWQPSTIVGQPDTILGRPVVTDPNVAAIGTGNKSVVFLDPSGYFVRRVSGVRFERSDQYAFNTDLVTFKAVVRLDAKGVHADAIRHLVHA